MKILFLLADLRYPGGITQYNLKFISALRELGATVVLVERKRGGLLSKIGFTVSFAAKMLFFRPEAVVCTNLHFSPLGLYAKKIFGTRYSVTVYGIEVVDIRKEVYRAALREAGCIVKLFDQAERDVLRQIPEAGGRVLRVPNSVDGDEFFIGEKSGELASRYGFSLEDKIAFTIARITKDDGANKGYERVIRAMPEVLKRVPSARYLLAGEGDDLPRMRELVLDMDLEGKVVFAGSIKAEELTAHYNLADVFVMPSKNEGFPPIVFLEALSCGIPVIGGSQPDALLPLWQEELAMIVPPDDVTSIGDALVAVLSGKAPQHFYDRDRLRDRVLSVYGLQGHKEHVKELLSFLKRP